MISLPLSVPDSLYERPIPERHRIIFYIGHLEAFDWNLFHDRVLGLKSFHLEFDRLFAFGIDPVGGGLPTDQPSAVAIDCGSAGVCQESPIPPGREVVRCSSRIPIPSGEMVFRSVRCSTSPLNTASCTRKL